MKHNVIFIDHKNREQLRWWNHTASKLVTVEYRQTMFDTKTYQPSGTLMHIKGLLANYVAKKNATFYPN